MAPATSKKRSATASNPEHAAAPSRPSNSAAAATHTIPATQMAFGMSHIVIYQELMTMRRTLDDVSRRQEKSDENDKNSETRLQELQPMPKRLDDLGAELNNHYAAAEERIRKQEQELRALANRLFQSDEKRAALDRKVEQLVAKQSLQATQEDPDNFRVVDRKRLRAVDGEEHISAPSEPQQQLKKPRIKVNKPKRAADPLPVTGPGSRPAKPKASKRVQTRFETFQIYKQSKMDAYFRAPHRKGNELRKFINDFIQGIEDDGISYTVQENLLHRFSSVRKLKTRTGSRFIAIGTDLSWEDVCQIVDDPKLREYLG
ncbi:hypothetical protein BDP81DRAFT_406466 [Colletotrichum phormii]|uniref:Uncharacterized protein n=1 Tax=Colletotrichum phormii TaxID=359342 RepID=A0AAI9ZRN6_9PEZI|nr:uncharacterized protein BDP81DRAFT_406466 [Colletotrichum phormii]KAK1636621.1 hypothetical protein BDP81DRAFT_406466 [Colletotrichum phormii]